MTSAALVCEALHEKGAYIDARPVLAVPAEAASSVAAFRVSLRPLGQALLLQVSFESPLGKVLDTRTMQLGHIEEVPVAAPRIADSLMTGKPLAETAKVDTLVGSETRAYAKQYGELKLGLGVFGFGVPGTDIFGGYGVHGQLYYETAAYAVGAELRLGGSSSSAGDATMEGVSLGARYFLNQGDITPFVGGGVGVLWLAYYDKGSSSNGYWGNYKGSGLALHGEAGIEFLRLHDARMDVLLRIDAPLYQMTNDDGSGNHHAWAPPISLMAAYSFN
jgi:hypothetical protein